MKKVLLIGLILVFAICFVAYASEDIEAIYWDIVDSVSERAHDAAWYSDPHDEWGFSEREEYIYRIGLMEGYEHGYDDGYDAGYEQSEFDHWDMIHDD